jgi:hypothetical protein
MDSFTHDVFISYSSADVDWAQQIDAALRKSARNYLTFFDRKALRAGDDWDATIQASLEASRHLVVLWSDNAKQSDWVTRELYSFMATAKPKVNTDRRLVMLNLQGMNQAMKSYQQISRTDLHGVYPHAGEVQQAVWDALQRDLEDALDPTRRVLTVPLVVLTATLDQLQNISPQRKQWLQADFGLTAASLPQIYGATRADWRPFAGAERISEVLETLRTQINGQIGQYRLEWQQPDETFWNDPVAASDFVTREFNTGELAVLIIDPVAVYEPDTVFPRLMLFHNSLTSDRTTIIALAPFAPPKDLVNLRQALFSRTVPYFNDYFRPSVPPARKLAAQCGWNAVDSEDVRRLLIAAAGRLSATQASASSPFTRQG